MFMKEPLRGFQPYRPPVRRTKKGGLPIITCHNPEDHSPHTYYRGDEKSQCYGRKELSHG